MSGSEQPFGGPGGLAGKDVWIFSNLDWDAPWQPVHEIASRLARANDATFVETTARRRPRLRDMPRLARRVRKVKPAATPARLRVLSPKVLPFPSSHAAARINAALLLRELGRAAAPPFVWAYLPSPTLLALLDVAPYERLVYHCMLDFPSLPHAPRGVAAIERELVARADLTVVDSKTLLDERRWAGENVAHVPSGARVDLFDARRLASLPVAHDVAALGRPVAGFTGSIDYRIDVDLLRAAAALAPDWSFALVGPADAPRRRALAGVPNVHLLPARAHSLLPSVLAGVDVCLIPYADRPVRRTTFPAKFFEYLATGRPVISTPLPDLEPYTELVEVVSSGGKLVAALERARREHPERARQRTALARANSWDARELEWGRLLRAAAIARNGASER